MTLASGNRSGSYEVTAALSAGGTGEVHPARDGRVGSEAAIKALPDELARDPERLPRFRSWPSELTRRAPLAGQQQNR